MPAKKHELTEIEKLFIKEADEGGFSVDYDDAGKPYAIGADGTSNLFSMDVEEVPQRDCSFYVLRT